LKKDILTLLDLLIMTQEVKSIAAVSPATRAIPKITLVTIPGAAAIKVVRLIAFHFVAPNAKAACLNDWGTIRNASSEPRITMGRIINARVSQPAMRDMPGQPDKTFLSL